MEIKTEMLTERTCQEITEMIARYMREGWAIHEIMEFDLGGSISGYTSQKEWSDKKLHLSLSKSRTTTIITFIKLSDEDRRIGDNIKRIADALSKNR